MTNIQRTLEYINTYPTDDFYDSLSARIVHMDSEDARKCLVKHDVLMKSAIKYYLITWEENNIG